jgi:integrase
LVEAEKALEKREAGATETSHPDVKGRLVEFAWKLQKQGYAEATVQSSFRKLLRLSKECDLSNPESVKETLARHKEWSNNYKGSLIDAYTRFLRLQGLKWDKPRYQEVRELPFIPTEAEIDALISGTSRKVSCVLQLLKETGMRIGEAWQLKWIDVDAENCTIKCKPEKGSNPRMFKVSQKLIAMLNTLPKVNDYVFGNVNLISFRGNYNGQRKRLAEKLQNPRLNKITFHTFRHWKATMEYAKTKDILHVRQLLGHKKLDNTLIYTQLLTFDPVDNYVCRAAKTVEEAKALIEAGFEYVCEMEDFKLFRKRK